MTLGERVLAIMREKGLTQKELADGIGAPPQTISGWSKKNRSPTADYVIPICRFFKITPNELYGYDEIQFDRIELTDDEEELLDIFRRLDRRGRRAVLHAADMEDDRVRLEGDNAETAT